MIYFQPGEVLTENQRLRFLLWIHHGHVGLYGDDGEMQCNMAYPAPPCDFKRASIEQIEVHLQHPLVATASTEDILRRLFLRWARAEVERLRAALERYGEHDTACPAGEHCTCGLRAALAG